MSRLGERLLHRLSRDPHSADFSSEDYEKRHERIEVCLEFLERTFPELRAAARGREVLDLGCAEGLEATALAKLGAARVIGVDLRLDPVQAAATTQAHAPEGVIAFVAGDAARLPFADGSVDHAVSLGSFEHFADPAAALRETCRVLRSGGRLFATSGVWRGPWGAHMNFFTKVPWVQFLFAERTVMRVRQAYRSDGAARYEEVVGGLNRVGVRSFLRLTRAAGLTVERLRLEPVRQMKFLTRLPLFDEFFTHYLVAVLRKPAAPA